MKNLLPIVLFFISINTNSQNIAGPYKVTGYFFHPSSSRAINLTKTITLIAPNTYQVDLGDVGPNLKFNFSIDSSNNLINWTAAGTTAVAPASGFMTLDNPGNIIFPGPVFPGTAPWIQSTYNNTYNPVTGELHMHYGYAGGSTSQNGYTRQVYEKWRLPINPVITSVSPLSGTAFTQVTISGSNFTGTDPTYGVRFGGAVSDSAVVVSDTEIRAWVGSGASGDVIVDGAEGSDSLSGFTYTSVPPVTNPQWNYAGTAGFSSGKAYFANTAIGRNNIPHVVFTDSATKRAMVRKLVSNNWVAVGSDVSDGISSNTRMVMDSFNNPIVAFTDSTNAGNLTVKRFNGSVWVNMGLPVAKGMFSMAIDGKDTIYLASLDTSKINILKYNGTAWTAYSNLGNTSAGGVNITADTTNNIPYFIYANTNAGGQASVKRLTGNTWTTLGAPTITNSLHGIFYPLIKIDPSGTPIVAFQEDNGFERLSSYKFSSGSWNPLGYQYFSKSHSHFPSLAIDINGYPFVSFRDGSYNVRGTVRAFGPTPGVWDTIGARGAIPFSVADPTAFSIDKNNNGYIAFSDEANGGRLSIMKKNLGVNVSALPKITSVSMLMGTSMTQITINGRKFTGVDPVTGISFGNVVSDSASILSDSVIVAWVASGANGKIKVTNQIGKDSIAGFTYNPVPPVSTPQWEYVGSAGFSATKAYHVNIASYKNNDLYVVFVDSLDRKSKVRKYAGSSWINVGPDVSDGTSSNSRIVLDSSGNPIVAFVDSTAVGNTITAKRFNGTSWINLSMPVANGMFSMAIDNKDTFYLASLNGSNINVSKYDGTAWNISSNLGTTSGGGVTITTDTANNVPYIVFANAAIGGQATVMKSAGTTWTTVGSAGFTNSLYGVYYPLIKIDPAGTPIVALQEDNGFERISSYKFTGGTWNPIGYRYFSKSHSYHLSLAIDYAGYPYVSFRDNSYNRRGTVLSFGTTPGKWDLVGARGEIPFMFAESNAFLINKTNYGFIAFPDEANGGRASVMKINTGCHDNLNVWTGAINSFWSEPGNWSCGIVPALNTNVVLNPGAVVILNVPTTVNTFNITPGATITVGAGQTLTITGP